MIIVAILALAGVVIALLVPIVGQIVDVLAPLASSVGAVLQWFIPYFESGMAFVRNICYWDNIVQPLLIAVLAIETIYRGYLIVLWIAKKIPMLGVSD